MHQLNVQLYARTENGDFSEDVSVRQTVTLGAEPSKTSLTIESPTKDKFVELRLDPDDKAFTFALHGLTVRSADGETLFSWDHDPDSLRNLTGLRAWQAENQVIMESSINDPFLLISLPRPEARIVLEASFAAAILGDEPKELAAAVRSLQSSLRAALDDLSNEQEALQESLLLNQAKSRSEVEAINEKFGALAPALREEVERSRNLMLAGVRDDWRSVRQQIADVADASQRGRVESESVLTANLEAEFAKLRMVVSRVAGSQEVMNEIRHELGIRRDEDAISELQKLKAELTATRERVRQIEGSFAWRITHPFGS